MEKHIIGENEIGYTLGTDGLYYPDLELPEGTHYEIGRYAWILDDVEIIEPIKAKGQLGIWNYNK